MKQYIFIGLLFLQSLCIAQVNTKYKTDFNTFFICIDSVSYNQLFLNKYIKDTLFICREVSEQTDTDSYTGKYLIGESATLEFFKPKPTNKLGDNFGDWGIEFKTRKLTNLNQIIAKATQLKLPIDTATVKAVYDTALIPWYKSLSFKNTKNELSILEYQLAYLQELGFTKSQIDKSMTFKEFNNILSNGKKYPRQFAMVSYIKLHASKKVITDLQQFAKLNNCKTENNTITNGETVIEYEAVENLPQFAIQEVGITLLSEQKFRIEKISDNIYLKVEGKKAKFIFK